MDTNIKVPEKLDSIRFHKNLNNKLNCEYFTTVRLNSAKFIKGNVYNIILDEKGVLRTICKAEIVELRLIQYHQMSDWMCYLDAGMNTDDFKSMLFWFYKDSVADFFNADYAYMILRKLKISVTQTSMF